MRPEGSLLCADEIMAHLVNTIRRCRGILAEKLKLELSLFCVRLASPGAPESCICFFLFDTLLACLKQSFAYQAQTILANSRSYLLNLRNYLKFKL
jgi:hypothetical protein